LIYIKDRTDQWNITTATVLLPVCFTLLFYAIAIWRFSATGSLFYLYNFGYIGTALGLGIFFNSALPKKKQLWGRRIAQLLIGSYMFVFVGFILRENMQIEGFFFYLHMGIFAGATLHYFIAKIGGTLFFGRGWCGWACWTAMILDLFPWRQPKTGRFKRYEAVRYLHFVLSLLLVLLFWYVLEEREIYSKSLNELMWLTAGNIFYYSTGIILAFWLKDNRAFCKYLCPIPVLQKVGSRFSLLKIKIDTDKCTNCGICEKNCPMDIKLLEYKQKGTRVLSTECIMCVSCISCCPHQAVDLTFGLDGSSVL
jgi:ferredoxin-type protein NapH